MSWLKKVTGIQELIRQQKFTNDLLSTLLDQNREENKKPKGPQTKN